MRLFIGSLPYTVQASRDSEEMIPLTDSWLLAWVEKWGITVLSSTLVTPDTGTPYAFCNVPKEQGSTAIKLLTGKVLGGKKITVREAGR